MAKKLKVETRIKKMGFILQKAKYQNMCWNEAGLKELQDFYGKHLSHNIRHSYINGTKTFLGYGCYLRRLIDKCRICYIDGKYIYEFHTRREMITDRLLTYEEYMDLYNQKQEELKDAREKNFNKIKNSRDIIKHMLKELGIHWSQGSGHMKVPIPMPADTPSYLINSSTSINIYFNGQTGIEAKLGENILLFKMDLAEPTFNDVFERTLKNWVNIEDIILGNKPNIQR